MTAPTSNGAIVADETAADIVAVNYNFSNTGSGGILQVLQSTQIYSISSGYPDAADTGWVPAVDASGNAPSAGAQSPTWSHVGFTQARGSKLYYYARRKNGATIELGAPYPVSEIVPSRPQISGVSQNSNFTTATVSAFIPSTDSFTTIYYTQTTTASPPVWQATSSSQTSPASHWQTSPSFTTTPGTNYYYWVLGWTHNNPGADGAARGVMWDKYAGVLGHGLRVWDALGNIRLDTTDRMIRHHSTLSGTITQAASPVSLFVSGITNDGTWGMSNDVPLSGDYSSTDDVSLTFGSTNYITLALQHTNSGSFNYRVQVFRI